MEENRWGGVKAECDDLSKDTKTLLQSRQKLMSSSIDCLFRVQELFTKMASEVVFHRPDDPRAFLVEWLEAHKKRTFQIQIVLCN